MKDGIPSTALAFMREELATIVQLIVKSRPLCGLGPTWHPVVAQCVASTCLTALNKAPGVRAATVADKAPVQPFASRMIIL